MEEMRKADKGEEREKESLRMVIGSAVPAPLDTDGL